MDINIYSLIMIKTSIIKKYLKEFPKNYLTFDIKYTKKESEYLDNFNITKWSTFNHYGNIDKLDDNKLDEFLTNIGNNQNINILNKIIHKLTNRITKAYQTKYCWLTIRVTLPHDGFNIPRWHKDGRFFKSDRNQTKFVTVLKGPGTLFIKRSKKVNEIYEKYRAKKFNEYDNLKEKTMINNDIENKYRKILANKFSPKNFKHNQLGSRKGLIFLTGSPNDNLKNGLLHSEPCQSKIDKLHPDIKYMNEPCQSTPRIFISILPGSESEILELQNKRFIRSNITWEDRLKFWKDGEYQTYSGWIKKRFLFETNLCSKKNMTNKYEEKFIESDELEKNINQLDNVSTPSYNPFYNQIKKSNNEYVIAFNNLSSNSRLVIPMPKKDKNFLTMKDFCDNASIIQQQEFWKKVAIEIELMLKTNDNIYISTDTLGVHYFHLILNKK